MIVTAKARPGKEGIDGARSIERVSQSSHKAPPSLHHPPHHLLRPGTTANATANPHEHTCEKRSFSAGAVAPSRCPISSPMLLDASLVTWEGEGRGRGEGEGCEAGCGDGVCGCECAWGAGGGGKVESILKSPLSGGTKR